MTKYFKNSILSYEVSLFKVSLLEVNVVYSKMSLTVHARTHPIQFQLLSKSLSLTLNSLDSWFSTYSYLYWELSGLKAGLICVGMTYSNLSIEPVYENDLII